MQPFNSLHKLINHLQKKRLHKFPVEGQCVKMSCLQPSMCAMLPLMPLLLSNDAPASCKPYIVRPSLSTTPSMETKMKRSFGAWK